MTKAATWKELPGRLWREESGQDLTEYVLLMALIALTAIAAMQGLAPVISTAYNNAASNLNAAT
ncbi:MAG: Flp family type IVb pilin [Candidatus Acidiferrales bacterium]